MWESMNAPSGTVDRLPDALTITYLWSSYDGPAFMGTSMAHLWSIAAFLLSLLHITFLALIWWKKRARQSVAGEQAPDVFEIGGNPKPDDTVHFLRSLFHANLSRFQTPPPPYEVRQPPKVMLLVAQMLVHIATFFAPMLTYFIYVWGELSPNPTLIDVMLCMVVAGQLIHVVIYVFRLLTYQPTSE